MPKQTPILHGNMLNSNGYYENNVASGIHTSNSRGSFLANSQVYPTSSNHHHSHHHTSSQPPSHLMMQQQQQHPSFNYHSQAPQLHSHPYGIHQVQSQPMAQLHSQHQRFYNPVEHHSTSSLNSTKNAINSTFHAFNNYSKPMTTGNSMMPTINSSDSHMRRMIADMVQSQQHLVGTQNSNGLNPYQSNPMVHALSAQSPAMNYPDINNNSLYSKNIMSNAFGNLSQAQHLNSNIGGVINTIISSAISGQFNMAAAAAAAAAAATANGGSAFNLVPPPSTTSDESKCHVCGDKSTGSHFGGISCESCKAFFRRSVQKNRHEDYKCSYSGECKMNTNTRKICQFCRYRACLSIGMRPKWVLSDDERQQKYGSRRKSIKKLVEQQQQPKSSSVGSDEKKMSAQLANRSSLESSYHSPDTNSVDDQNSRLSSTPAASSDVKQEKLEIVTSNSDTDSDIFVIRPSDKEKKIEVKDEPTSYKDIEEASASYAQNSTVAQEESEENLKAIRELVSKKGVFGIDESNLSLNEYERELIDHLSCIFYNARHANPLNFSNINEILSKLPSKENVDEFRRHSKVFLANFIIVPVQRLITFSKYLTDFCNLTIDDRMSLLKGGAMEVHIFTAASLYDNKSQTLDNVVSKDRQLPGNDSKGILLNLMRFAWSDELFAKTLKFLGSMSQLGIDEVTYVLFVPIILLTPDRRDLKDRKRIAEAQAKYTLLLKKYLKWKFGTKRASMILTQMLLKLLELRTLHENHSSILLDTDPEKLSSVPLSIIMNEKSALASTSSSASESTATTTSTSVRSDSPESSNDNNDESNQPVNQQQQQQQQQQRHQDHQSNEDSSTRTTSYESTPFKHMPVYSSDINSVGSTSSSLSLNPSSQVSTSTNHSPGLYNNECSNLNYEFDQLNAPASE